MKNKMVNVRDHLIATLEALVDPETKVDLERTRLIVDVSQTLINSAKVEVDYVNAAARFADVTGKAPTGTGFLLQGPQQ